MASAPHTATDQSVRYAILFSLIVTTCLGSFGQITMATLAGIVGANLSAMPQLATLPVVTGIIGVSIAAWPMAMARKRFGDRIVFTFGLLWAAGGSALAAWSIIQSSFIGFCCGCFFMGNNMSLVAQYRFTAAALVPSQYVSRAVSGLMTGTLVAAVIAPWFALRNRFWLDVEFAGSFAMLAVLSSVTALMMALLPLPSTQSDTNQQHSRIPISGLLRNRQLQLAIVSGAAGYAVMTLIMTATPISMHVMEGHSAEATANTIRMHILAMFAPSLISGWLIAKLGVRLMLWVGVVLQAVCVGIAASGHAEWQYQAALIALGAGWNLLFIGGTTLIATASDPAEGPRLQGLNDLVVFGAMAFSALLAGALLQNVGWVWTNLLGAALLVLIPVALLRSRPH